MDLPDTRSKDSRRRRRIKQRRALVAIVVALAVLGGGTWAAWGTLGPVVARITESDDWEGQGTGTVDVKVSAGDSGRAIARTLVDAGVVKTQSAFVSAANAQPDMAGIQPGTYRLKEHMSGAAAVALMLDPAAKVTTKLTVPEGLTAAQVVALVEKQTGISADDLNAALANPAALGLPAAANGNPEGFLFPATYDVDPDETAVELLTAMVTQTNTVLGQLGVTPEQVRDVVIKASIAQKEARSAEDMTKVVRVLDNRLADGMNLQLDSTVSYGVGSTNSVTTTPEQRAADNGYNTYLHPGLPAGPISNPGEDALRAALQPAEGTWLFFVTVDLATGETRFATTGAEHDANVKLFQQYLRDHPEQQ
ncbi:endolytic transglycosylase MltG [Kineococcus sp. SYSU DK003]|uniref:endolytic transglycosylase MltG n=1 Tax=Kineococcus sp. SYSU DK003 TaxID=3383124 RepID=UPI003D7C6DAF